MIPVFIITRNRVSMLQKTVDQIRKVDGLHPVVIDNASDWPPMLDYLEKLKADPLVWGVYRLSENLGCYAPWMLNGKKTVMDFAYPSLWRCENYIVTDDDLDLSGCFRAGNFIGLMKWILDSYPKVVKAGASLEIKGLPQEFPLKNAVISDQGKYWQDTISTVSVWSSLSGRKIGVPLYKANIDTTFAMYRVKDIPKIGPRAVGPGIRIGRPFVAKHRPWYQDVNDLTQEDLHYIKTSSTYTYWTDMMQKYFEAKAVSEDAIA